jgi:hypothetical protein
MTSHSGHAALTLQLWHSDARFTGDDARPLDLPFAGQELSFTSLVRSVGGDIPPGAVRAELVSAGAIVETENGLLKALKRYFVPSDKGEDLIVGLERIVYPVLEGLARNVGPLGKEPFVQRLAYSDRILPAAVPLVRQIAQEKCEEFLHSVDDLLCANERSVEVRPEDRTRIGVGVFYFEGGPPD